MKNFLPRTIATGFGVGYFPLAPGTMGSLAVLIIYWKGPEISWSQLLVIIIGVATVGIYSATITENEIKARLGPDKGMDPGIIVIDEMVGMLIALIALPKTKFFLIMAFVLFRFFDILKINPAKQLEKLPGGWGIVLDDVIAGIYANIVIQIGRRIF